MYQAVGVYDLQSGAFLGYGIKEEQAIKLQSTNLYSEAEMAQLGERLGALNDSKQVRAQWPDVRDPEVQALLANEDWEPLEKEEQSVLDEENSYLVYQKVEELNKDGQPTGQVIDGPDLDRNASVLNWKTVLAAKPSDVALRIKNAQEAVARQRVAA